MGSEIRSSFLYNVLAKDSTFCKVYAIIKLVVIAC